jgi:hypothetical protein
MPHAWPHFGRNLVQRSEVHPQRSTFRGQGLNEPIRMIIRWDSGMHDVRSLLKIEPITASVKSYSHIYVENLREDCTTLSSHFLSAVI